MLESTDHPIAPDIVLETDLGIDLEIVLVAVTEADFCSRKQPPHLCYRLIRLLLLPNLQPQLVLHLKSGCNQLQWCRYPS
jgi:hypothetical protein